MGEVLREVGSITGAFRRFGIGDYSRRRLRISAVQASAAEAMLLEQSRGQPVLQSTGVSVDADGVPIQLARARYAAHWLELVIEYDRLDTTG